MKHVDLEKRTSFLDQRYSGCAQHECKPHNCLVDDDRNMFESRISAEAAEKLMNAKKMSAWSHGRHGRTCEEMRETILRTGNQKNVEQLYKVPTPCIDEHRYKQERKTVGELSKVCSQIVLKCLYMARIGRPENLWSVNKLAGTVTKWMRACDRRLAPSGTMCAQVQ